ncbi:hypothetical protein NFI96_020431 [Prochilodus magdalenae]|nr:hypothetical protein NFI96_020431 [Prochilodus magdalenae]
MRGHILFILAVLHSVSGQNYDVHQNPSDLLSGPGEHCELYCNHSSSTFRTILWYQQSSSEPSLKLIGHVNYKNAYVERSFEGHFNVTGDGKKTLHSSSPQSESS